MKEEYEAQERERLAALKESRGQDDGEVEEETMIADFDGVMWGFPTGPSKPDQSQGESKRKGTWQTKMVFFSWMQVP